MVINVAVIDEDNEIKSFLKEYLIRFVQESIEEIDINIAYFACGNEIINRNRSDFHIIFMDVNDEDDISSARRIRETDCNAVIVFMSNSDLYANQGYSIDALDFLIKPLSYDTFMPTIKRAIKKLPKCPPRCLVKTSRNGVALLKSSEIVYIESVDGYVITHTRTEKYKEKGALKLFEDKFLSLGFFRVAASQLINLAYVNAVIGNNVIIGKSKLRIDEPLFNDFMKALGNYIKKAHQFDYAIDN